MYSLLPNRLTLWSWLDLYMNHRSLLEGDGEVGAEGGNQAFAESPVWRPGHCSEWLPCIRQRSSPDILAACPLTSSSKAGPGCGGASVSSHLSLPARPTTSSRTPSYAVTGLGVPPALVHSVTSSFRSALTLFALLVVFPADSLVSP